MDGALDVNMAMTLKQYTGHVTESLWLMLVLGEAPITIGQTCPSKEIVMLQIAEKANFSGCPSGVTICMYMHLVGEGPHLR